MLASKYNHYDYVADRTNDSPDDLLKWQNKSLFQEWKDLVAAINICEDDGLGSKQIVRELQKILWFLLSMCLKRAEENARDIELKVVDDIIHKVSVSVMIKRNGGKRQSSRA